MKNLTNLTGSQILGIFFVLCALKVLCFNHNALATPDIHYIKDIQLLQIPTPSPEEVATEFTHFTSGTGFFVSQHHIVTNQHVVRECRHIRIRGAVRPGYAKLLSVDSKNDLALLVTNRTPKRIAPLRKDSNVTTGEKVTVMGYPLERGIEGKYLVRKGSITNAHDSYNGLDRIEFSDLVSKGNSGGPLLDSNGSVIGVVVGKMSFYLADGNLKQHEEPVKTSSIAINLSDLKQFLDKNNVYYRTDQSQYQYQANWLENKAKQYIVNIHCVKDE